MKKNEAHVQFLGSPLTNSNHMAVDGSVRGVAGKIAACEPDVDGGNEPWFAMNGTMAVELQAQRTILYWRAEKWALFVASNWSCGHVH